ncbi:hypothetical protein K1719_039317 [Acacia pycnantha]|nr:hypothetical protein K1719_039317 [Acacia pycnantha]
MTNPIAPGVGANLLSQHAAERNQDATAYVGNLTPQLGWFGEERAKTDTTIQGGDERNCWRPATLSVSPSLLHLSDPSLSSRNSRLTFISASSLLDSRCLGLSLTGHRKPGQGFILARVVQANLSCLWLGC